MGSDRPELRRGAGGSPGQLKLTAEEQQLADELKKN